MSRSEVRMQAWLFDNFFQVSDPSAEQDVSALGTELRAAYQPLEAPFEFYGHVNYLIWDETDRPNTHGGRVGAARDGEIHDLNVFFAHAQNQAAIDIGDTATTADVTTLSGEYSYRLGDWELGGEALRERHRFEDVLEQDSDYTTIGGSVRYRGFGWQFSPELGLTTGGRDSDDRNESYDEPAWYLQLVYMPTARVYLSLRYRERERHYNSALPGDSNFDRFDERPQWTSVGTVQLTERFSGMWYYSWEDVDSSRPSRDFDSSVLILGLEMKF
jgi:hypothetical protein